MIHINKELDWDPFVKKIMDKFKNLEDKISNIESNIKLMMREMDRVIKKVR